jgi:hypothetical protein
MDKFTTCERRAGLFFILAARVRFKVGDLFLLKIHSSYSSFYRQNEPEKYMPAYPCLSAHHIGKKK